MTLPNPPEPSAVLSGRSFGVEVGDAGRPDTWGFPARVGGGRLGTLDGIAP
jgi:hypothetical protein